MPSTCIIIVYLFIYISLRKLKSVLYYSARGATLQCHWHCEPHFHWNWLEAEVLCLAEELKMLRFANPPSSIYLADWQATVVVFHLMMGDGNSSKTCPQSVDIWVGECFPVYAAVCLPVTSQRTEWNPYAPLHRAAAALELTKHPKLRNKGRSYLPTLYIHYKCE